MLDFVDGIARATNLEDVWALHCDTMESFGFDRLIYGVTRVAGADGSLGDFEDALLLSNHDRAYFDRFVSEKMFLDAPGIRWARKNAGAIGWGELWQDAPSLTAGERRVVTFNQSMNVIAGYSISFAGTSPRTFGMISLTGALGLSQADLDETWAKHGRRILAMNNILHLKVLSLPHRTLRADLSARQREALEWVGDGKSYQDIATIMGVGVPTVEKHLRLAREKLGVATTAQAVLKAAFQNQIYVLHRLPESGRDIHRTVVPRNEDVTET